MSETEGARLPPLTEALHGLRGRKFSYGTYRNMVRAERRRLGLARSIDRRGQASPAPPAAAAVLATHDTPCCLSRRPWRSHLWDMRCFTRRGSRLVSSRGAAGSEQLGSADEAPLWVGDPSVLCNPPMRYACG